MSKISDQTGDDWAAMAKIYKSLTVGVGNKPVEALLTRLNALFPLSKATAIHDNGCGPGAIISRLIKDYGTSIPSDCTLSASDFSKPMIEQIQKNKDEEIRADPQSPWNRLEIFVQDATNLQDIASNSKSHLTAGWVYFMTANPQKCLTESLRVLAPGGVLACSSWQDSQWLQIMNLVEKIRPDKETTKIPEEWRHTDLLEKEFLKAGFRDVEAHEVQVEMTFDDYEPLIDMLTTTMPHMINMLKDFSEEEITKLREAMLERVKEHCPTVPGRLTGVSLVASGRK